MPLKINLKSVIMYAVYTAAMVLMNKAIDGVPLSVGLCFAMLLCGTNIIATPVLYVAASAVHLNWIMTLLSLFEGGFLCAVTFLYRRTHRKIKFEGIAYITIALSLYIPFAPWKGVSALEIIDNEYALKSIAAAATIVFSFFCFKTVYAVMYRVYRCRLREDELVCCAVVYTAIGKIGRAHV